MHGSGMPKANLRVGDVEVDSYVYLGREVNMRFISSWRFHVEGQRDSSRTWRRWGSRWRQTTQDSTTWNSCTGMQLSLSNIEISTLKARAILVNALSVGCQTTTSQALMQGSSDSTITDYLSSFKK